MKKFLKKDGGFTLIEILVVIGIIAILAAIVLIAINPARQFAQARNTQRTSNVNAILNAVGQYVADHQGELPTDIDAVVGTFQDISSVAAESNICANLVPNYLPALPIDPDPDATNPDEPIDATGCGSAYDTGYTINKSAEGRVTICSPESNDETALPGITEEICVTR